MSASTACVCMDRCVLHGDDIQSGGGGGGLSSPCHAGRVGWRLTPGIEGRVKVLSSFRYSPLLLNNSSRFSPERGGVLPLIHSAAVETAISVSQSWSSFK